MYRAVKLPDGVAGRLYLGSMPGRYEVFQEALAGHRRTPDHDG